MKPVRPHHPRQRCLSVEHLESRSLLSASELDPSFGNGGRTVIRFDDSAGGYSENAVSSAIDRVGRTVIVGNVSRLGGGPESFAITRLTTNGTLDSSFGDHGKRVLESPISPFNSGIAVSVHSDSLGRIVVAGQLVSYGDRPDSRRSLFAAVRLTPTGAVDSTFGDNGWATVGFSGDQSGDDVLAAATIDSSGRILLAGITSSRKGNPDFAVARLTTAGRLDNTFSDDGLKIVGFDVGGGKSDEALSITTDKFGRIVVAGSVETSSSKTDFGVIRLTDSGRLDKSFHRDGRNNIAFKRLAGNKGLEQATDVAVDSLGRIIVAGRTETSASDMDFAVARLNTVGNLDRTFGHQGRLVVPFNLGGNNVDGAQEEGYGDQRYRFGRVTLSLDTKERIVVCGPVQRTAKEYDFGVFRLTTEGKTDAMFGDQGRKVIGFNQTANGIDHPLDVVTDKQDRVIIVGRIQATPPDAWGHVLDWDIGVARIRPKVSRPGSAVPR